MVDLLGAGQLTLARLEDLNRMESLMKLRTLVGGHAGEVREFPEHIGRRLVADGRAQDPEKHWAPREHKAPVVPVPERRNVTLAPESVQAVASAVAGAIDGKRKK